MIPVTFASETVVVKCKGGEGDVERLYSSKSYEDCDCIILIIDPRNFGAHYYSTGLKQHASKLKVVILLPSTSSSKECLMRAENAVMGCCVSSTFEGAEKLFVRLDDYLAHGDGIISAMISAGKTVYPAEEMANLKAMIDATSGSIYENRAFFHWIIGEGAEDSEIDAFFAEASAIFGKDDCGLPSMGPVSSDAFLTTEAICPNKDPTVYFGFNDDTTNSLTADLGVTVNLLTFPGNPYDFDPGIQEGTPGFHQEEASAEEVCAASSAVAGWCTNCNIKLEPPSVRDKVTDEEGDPIFCSLSGLDDRMTNEVTCKREDPSEMKEGECFSICTECKRYYVCNDCYLDLPEGEAKEAAMKKLYRTPQKPSPQPAGKDYVLFLDLEKDISFPPPGFGSGTCAPLAWMRGLREVACDRTLVVILMAESYESLATNPYLAVSMGALLDADVVLFCLKSDTEHIKTFCCGAKAANETVFKVFSRAMIPFPRLHFFTFANAMGRKVDDGSIIGPSFTIHESPVGASIDASKYSGRLTLPNADGSFANDRVLPGAPGTNTTIVNNAKFIDGLIESLKGEDPKDEDGDDMIGECVKAKFKELGGFDEDFLDYTPNSVSDMTSISSEYRSYLVSETESE